MKNSHHDHTQHAQHAEPAHRAHNHPHAHGAAVAAASPSAEPGQWTCPMHPQIVRNGPGHCPTCGMALEPVMPSLEDDENPELRDFSRRFWWTLPLTVVVVTLAMAGHRLQLVPAAWQSWIELVLSAPVVLWAGWPFFTRGVQSVTN